MTASPTEIENAMVISKECGLIEKRMSVRRVRSYFQSRGLNVTVSAMFVTCITVSYLWFLTFIEDDGDDTDDYGDNAYHKSAAFRAFSQRNEIGIIVVEMREVLTYDDSCDEDDCDYDDDDHDDNDNDNDNGDIGLALGVQLALKANRVRSVPEEKSNLLTHTVG